LSKPYGEPGAHASAATALAAPLAALPVARCAFLAPAQRNFCTSPLAEKVAHSGGHRKLVILFQQVPDVEAGLLTASILMKLGRDAQSIDGLVR